MSAQHNVNYYGTETVHWAVDGWQDQPAELRTAPVTLVFRLDAKVPLFTSAVAAELRVLHDVAGAGHVTMTVTGTPVFVQWPSCGSQDDCTDDTVASPTGTRWHLEGDAELGPLATPGAAVGVATAYLASNALIRSYFAGTDTDDPQAWHLRGGLRSPYTAAGGTVRGAFSTWVPREHFTSLGATLEQAVASGIAVTTDHVTQTFELAAHASVRDGGIVVRVPDFAFPAHDIRIYNRAPVPSTATVPLPPTNVRVANETSGVLTVRWTPAPPQGGPSIESEAWALSSASGGRLIARCQSAASGCHLSVPQNVEYHIAVRTENPRGNSALSSPRVPAIRGNVPGAPRTVTVSPGNARLAVGWTAPASAGHRPVSGYTAAAYPAATPGASASTCTVAASARTCALTGLRNGVGYSVVVRARSAIGTGAASGDRLGVPAVPPSTPRGVRTSWRTQRLTVAWAPPSSTGGAAVTGYRVAVYPNATTRAAVATCIASARARTCTLASLRSGRTYHVAVSAQNAVGSSPASTRRRVTT